MPTNYEWLLNMGGEERQAWFDAEHAQFSDSLAPENGVTTEQAGANDGNAALASEIERLTAELAKRDKGIERLKRQRDEAREERERYRSLLSDAIGRAHGIVTLVDMDGEVVG